MLTNKIHTGDALEMTHKYYIKKYESNRFDKLCHVICRGKNGNVLIEFEDGHKMVTIRFGIRRRIEGVNYQEKMEL